jgi:PAS domain S-box-containing protein
LKEFLADQLDFLGTGMNLHQVWIMDSTGKLLFHSEHRDMVGRGIYQRDEKCRQCYTSFDHAEKILKARQGTVNYKLKGSPGKIAAFAPMNFEDLSWIVVVNSSYDEVTAVVKKSFGEFLALLTIVVLAAILGSASIIRTDRFKVKAEEEVKHWREKRILEDKIKRSEALYQTIVENAHDAIWTVDTQGHLTFVNRRGEEIAGYKVSELVGKDFEPLLPPEDLPRAKDLLMNVLHGKVENFEVRFYARDGKIRLLSVNSVPLYKNGKVIGLFSIGRDITEHREAEKALQESQAELRYLSSQLLTAQETERRRISKELHDELGQALTAIKLQVSFIEKGLKQDQVAIKKECESTSKYVDQVIEEVRRLSRDLTPSILEDAGLLVAIHWLVGNSNKIHNINIIITMDVTDIDDLFSQNAQITIYRILQEALTNIGKHAQAKNVSVTIKKEADRVFFSVEDDGIGFDMPRVAMVNPSQRGLGLAILEERARMLGGSFQIWSEKGKGTRISFYVPPEKGESV